MANENPSPNGVIDAADAYAKSMSRPGGAVYRSRKDLDRDAFIAGADYVLANLPKRETLPLASTTTDEVLGKIRTRCLEILTRVRTTERMDGEAATAQEVVYMIDTHLALDRTPPKAQSLMTASENPSPQGEREVKALDAAKLFADRLYPAMSWSMVLRSQIKDAFMAGWDACERYRETLPSSPHDDAWLREKAISYLAEINDYGREDFPEGRFGFEIHELVKAFRTLLDHSRSQGDLGIKLTTASENPSPKVEREEYIYCRIKRPSEGYEDVCDELVLEDFIANPKADWTVELATPTETLPPTRSDDVEVGTVVHARLDRVEYLPCASCIGSGTDKTKDDFMCDVCGGDGQIRHEHWTEAHTLTTESVSAKCPRCGDLPYDPKSMIADMRQHAQEWEEQAKLGESEGSKEFYVRQFKVNQKRIAELEAEVERLRADLDAIFRAENGS